MKDATTQIQTFPLGKVSSLGSRVWNQKEHTLSLERTGIARERVEA